MADERLSEHQILGTNWVWRSSPQSVYRQQPSVLAVLEMVIATFAYWGFASVTSWPYLTLIGVVAVPLLLLKSPSSIAYGKIMLQSHIQLLNNRQHIERYVFPKLSFIVVVCFSLLCPYLDSNGSLLLSAFTASILVLSTVTFLIIIAFTFGHQIPGVVVGRLRIRLYIFLLPLFLITVLYVLYGQSVLALLFGIFFGGLLTVSPHVRHIVVDLGMTLGLFLRILIIRVKAALFFAIGGLGFFTKNCRESLIVIDVFHQPQALPDASDVTQLLDVAHLWQMRHVSLDALYARSTHLITKSLLTTIIVLPAALYRFNIKANAWLWGVLAIALNPRRWGRDSTERSTLGNLASTIVQGAILIFTVGLAAILGKHLLPMPFPDLLKNTAGEWLKPFIETSIDMPLLSARGLILSLLLTNLIWLLFKAFTFGNSNTGVLTNPADWMLLDEKGKAEQVRIDGLQVLKALKFTLLSATFTVWVFIFWTISNTAWGQSRFPHAVWSWIRPYL